jgi:hypothetical protein
MTSIMVHYNMQPPISNTHIKKLDIASMEVEIKTNIGKSPKYWINY